MFETAHLFRDFALQAGVRDEDRVLDAVRGHGRQRRGVLFQHGRRGRSEIAQAIDAQTLDRFVVGAPMAVVGSDDGGTVAERGVKQDEQIAQGEEVHPPQAVAVVGVLVVALHRQAGDVCGLQFFQAGNGLVQGKGVDAAFLEEVAGQDDEVDILCDGGIDHGQERPGKVVEALLEVVLPVAEMTVRDVHELRLHGPLAFLIALS